MDVDTVGPLVLYATTTVCRFKNAGLFLDCGVGDAFLIGAKNAAFFRLLVFIRVSLW
jgi:hypothetical protein